MERQLWKSILEVLATVDKPAYNPRLQYPAEFIVRVWIWAVMHDRPVRWACCIENWPIHYRKQSLPSNSTMSRRLRSKDVRQLLLVMEQQVFNAQAGGNIIWMIDGKPLCISGSSKDRQSGFGRAASAKAKGYKLHVILGSDRSLSDWRVAPMNKDERVMAGRMLKSSRIQGYLLADSNYDSNKLHDLCDQKGNLQLISRRRYGKRHGHGHRKQTPGRMRSKEILENPMPHFGDALIQQREDIERYFGNLTNWGGGLTALPPWCRTHRRVHRWIQAKLILSQLKPRATTMTYAA